MRAIVSEFREFVMRGNVVDLAIAVVIGVAFTGIVTALVNGIIMPLILAVGGKPSFDQYYLTLNNSRILVGTALTAIVNFLIVAAVIFFLVLKPLNALMALRARHNEPPAEPDTRECPYCLSEIPLKATRCRYCTADVAPVPVTVGAQGKPAER
jgi:large conductance mechanosensitive channel